MKQFWRDIAVDWLERKFSAFELFGGILAGELIVASPVPWWIVIIGYMAWEVLAAVLCKRMGIKF